MTLLYVLEEVTIDQLLAATAPGAVEDPREAVRYMLQRYHARMLELDPPGPDGEPVATAEAPA